jgi:hypothetical protein
MSTAMSNNLQAGMGTPSAAEAGRAKCSTGALHKNKDVYIMLFRQEQYQYVQRVGSQVPHSL